MRFLDYIDSDTSGYISLKEAISLLVEKTKWTINEVAIYLLNKEVPEELACLVKGSDYKIKISSGKRFSYGVFRPYGKDWAFEYLTNIAELSNGTTWVSIEKYTAHWDYWNAAFICDSNLELLENVYWHRNAFFDADPIRSLNLFPESPPELNKNLIPIWDDNYLYIQENYAPDLEAVDEDSPHYELIDLYIESEQIQIDVKKEVPLLYLNDTLTVIEAACIISGDNPAEIIEVQNDEALLASYKRFKNAKSVVDSAIKLCTLTEYSDINILAYDFKVFLKSRGYIIEGFNDDLDEKESLAELTEQIQRQAVYIAQIENEIGFYQRMSQGTLRDVDFDKLLDAQNDDAFRSKADKTILEKRVLFLEQQLENSQIEIGKLNTLLDGYSKSGDEVMQKKDSITPEQEIPHSRQRNNVLRIISILSQMADLPPEPFSAFNVLEAYADQNNKEIPSKHTVAGWLKKARDSN